MRKGVLIRRIIALDLCTAVGCQQFRKESRKRLKITKWELAEKQSQWTTDACWTMRFSKKNFRFPVKINYKYILGKDGLEFQTLSIYI